MVNMFSSHWRMIDTQCDPDSCLKRQNIDEKTLQYPLLTNLFPFTPFHAKPTCSRRPLRILRLTTVPRKSSLTHRAHMPTAPDKIVIEAALPRPSRIALTAYPPSWSRPRLGFPHCPPDSGLELTRSPARNNGAQGLGWSSAEDLSLPASDHMRRVEFSSIGFLRAFIDDLRTDRERVESSASFENNHGSAIDLDYSSDTPTSAYRPCQFHDLKTSHITASTSSASGLRTIPTWWSPIE